MKVFRVHLMNQQEINGLSWPLEFVDIKADFIEIDDNGGVNFTNVTDSLSEIPFVAYFPACTWVETVNPSVDTHKELIRGRFVDVPEHSPTNDPVNPHY